MMRRVPPRRSRSPIRRPARTLLGVAVLTGGLLLSGAFVGIAMRQTEVQQEARGSEQQIAAELARRGELQAQIDQRRTDAYVVEKAHELGYVRPGEGLIAVERGPGGAPAVRVSASDGGRLGRWLALFFAAR